MKREKKKRLEAAGWAIGDVTDFLDLRAEEREFVEMKLALADGLKRRRKDQELSQESLARLLGSSQSRVAKMEAADRTVTVDLLVRSLLALGATSTDVARIIRRAKKRSAA
jgi:predicted XRE-type DNA-binding protein